MKARSKHEQMIQHLTQAILLLEITESLRPVWDEYLSLRESREYFAKRFGVPDVIYLDERMNVEDDFTPFDVAMTEEE